MQFPEPKDLDIPFVDRIGDGRPKVVAQYDLNNPHPGFGKDPNIVNEYGHTLYPKMVYPDGPMTTTGKVVHNAAEEAEVMGQVEDKPKGNW